MQELLHLLPEVFDHVGQSSDLHLLIGRIEPTTCD